MVEDIFRYDLMVETALRSVVKETLKLVSQRGLSDNRSLYITFKTRANGVKIPEYLVKRYPDKMTIILQFQFWKLEVMEDKFSIMLSFNDVLESLEVPFEAITGFTDPSVKFGLQFEHVVNRNITLQEEFPAEKNSSTVSADVVSLDQFRNKK
ncbi:hypothetical protein A1OE_762 [Candidatus Endolissoclinum faulkneri L2]|uniref:Stringent starvation B family protein n=1 Tax=Candidatus Endolissoclinum faulkneri L2 TaxID=1193729 RepID=K7Z4N0_9PROT|nr:ClpXP protease specificity-enhancing factor SspB [Candidatus Endolissoclinum faulkneri]AFX98948.1 hypothetical protein A1OE_762 [Candidatus Endolissoclinum faulkneri L2]